MLKSFTFCEIACCGFFKMEMMLLSRHVQDFKHDR
eukprot:UN25283